MPLKDKAYTVYKLDRLRQRRRRRLLLYGIAAFVVVLLAVGGGSYLWLNGLVSHPTDPGIQAALESTPVDAIETPTGMDILLIGSDHRAAATDEEESRSDTVILVHADPDENYLSMLSFPRDLRVEVPGRGVQKLNSAYAFGGAELTIRTVKQLTGINIQEYLEVDFQAFRDITDSLGGVYVDVDRRYYNDNPEWELIKLSPGYQRLDGAKTLDYVRYRHDLNYDFGRMERQQRFLTALREQAMGWNLPLKLPGVIKALFSNIVTTLGTNDLIRLAAWGVRLDGSRIRQLTIRGDIRTVDDVSYVIPAEGAIDEALAQLTTPPAEATTVATGTEVTGQSAGTSEAGASVPTFVTDLASIENSVLWHLYASASPFQVMAPGYLPDGYAYVDKMPAEPGVYELAAGDSSRPALKMVYQLTREGEKLDQYMGIMETTWLDAPAASDGLEIEKNGVTYTVVGTNQRTDRIWWKQGDVLYWVSNTLSFCLTKKELLNVAQSMIVVPAGGSVGG